MSPEERFWSRIEKTSTCWLWRGSTLLGLHGKNRYGRLGIGKKIVMVHRFAYELAKGPIPLGLTIDHLCRNTLCVNPDHLEAVTMRENLMRGHSPIVEEINREICRHGHPLSGDNLLIYMDDGRPVRLCWICKRAQNRASYLKKKARRLEE